jgi:hypothetical protein
MTGQQTAPVAIWPGSGAWRVHLGKCWSSYAPSTKNALQRYHVMRVPTDDNDDPVMTVGREQQLGAYKLVCQAHILPAEPDFSETIGAVLPAAIVGCSVQPAVGIRYSSDANFNGPTL